MATKDSGQPGYPRRQIKVFTVSSMKTLWVLDYQYSAQLRLITDCTGVQADLMSSLGTHVTLQVLSCFGSILSLLIYLLHEGSKEHLHFPLHSHRGHLLLYVQILSASLQSERNKHVFKENLLLKQLAVIKCSCYYRNKARG